MNFSIKIILAIAVVAICVQSASITSDNQNVNVRKYLQKKVFQQYMQQKMGQEVMQTSEKNKKASFKSALAKFSKCNKLRVKMMIKYRNRPRLLRRISKLTLDC